jgi:hypothetical protein
VIVEKMSQHYHIQHDRAEQLKRYLVDFYQTLSGFRIYAVVDVDHGTQRYLMMLIAQVIVIGVAKGIK